MEKLGILIDRPGRTQKFYTLATELNKLASNDVDIIVFYLEYGLIPVQTKFALMEMNYCINYDGILISTDITTTEIMMNNLNAKRKYFYLWDLEWLRGASSFNRNNNIYNSDIPLICRSNFHYHITNIIWKQPLNIIEDFNYEKIREL